MAFIISSKEFDSKVTLDNLRSLEKYSNESIEFFKQPNFKVKLADIQADFPAFIEPGEPPILYIKQPTYKIKVLLFGRNASEQVNSLLGHITGLSHVYLTHCFVKDHLGNMREDFLPEVVCLNTTLSDNESLKDNVCEILSNNHLTFEVWAAYSITGQPVSINEFFVEPYTKN